MNTPLNLIIDKRFCGPPASGNGGYVAGCLASMIDGGSQVTLHAPPPLDTPMQLRTTDSGAELWLDEQRIGSAVPSHFELDVPPMPDLDQVAAAEPHYAGFSMHNLPGCFVCGPDRRPGDGLRIFAGPLAEGLVATRWQAPVDLADERGNLLTPFVWAALDCPGYFAVNAQSGPALLGRFAVKQYAPVPVAEPLLVMGWALTHDGRKHQAGTAIYHAGGRLLAKGLATWISLSRV